MLADRQRVQKDIVDGIRRNEGKDFQYDCCRENYKTSATVWQVSEAIVNFLKRKVYYFSDSLQLDVPHIKSKTS